MASRAIAPLAANARTGRRLRDSLAGSPGRLRRIGAIGLLSVLLIALGGAGFLVLLGSALAESATAFDQVELIQSARTDLLRADAAASNAFLRGGLEPTDQRRRYLASIASVSEALATAANAGPRDPRYAGVVSGLVEYSGLIETARSLNRQTLPVGANYLRIGSTLLQTDVLEPLRQIAELDSRRAARGFSAATRAGIGFAVCTTLGLAGLVWSHYRLARLTRSVFTLPMALTSMLLIGVTIGTALLVVLSVRQTVSIRDDDSVRTAALVQARASAFEAKAAESHTLIGRGSRPETERQWIAAMDESRAQVRRVDPDLLATLDSYARKHAAIRTLDTDGKWTEAVELAVADGGTSPGAAFERFDRDSTVLLGQAIRTTVDGLRAARGGLGTAALALVLAGLIAATGVGRGIADRLGEYR